MARPSLCASSRSPLLAAAAQAEPPRTFTEAEADGASLRYHGNIPIAMLSGTPEEIGRQHAALLAEPARATCSRSPSGSPPSSASSSSGR